MAKNNLARKLAQAQDVRTYAVVLPGDVADTYEGQAKQAGDGRPETTLSKRLVDCVTHSADKPLYFSDVQRQELERLLDNNFSKADQVLDHLRSYFTMLKVLGEHKDKSQLVLAPNQVYRLVDRAKAAGMTVAEYAIKVASNAINRETGLY